MPPSAYCVILVVQRSNQPEADSSFYRQNEVKTLWLCAKRSISGHPQVTVVMSLIGKVVPMCFGLIEMLEAYHPRTVRQSCTPATHCFFQAMQLMLTRIMALNLLSLYSLMFAFFDKTQTYVSALCVAGIFSQHVKISSITGGQFAQVQDAERLLSGGRWLNCPGHGRVCGVLPYTCTLPHTPGLFIAQFSK